jgi:hypothetical protein
VKTNGMSCILPSSLKRPKSQNLLWADFQLPKFIFSLTSTILKVFHCCSGRPTVVWTDYRIVSDFLLVSLNYLNFKPFQNRISEAIGMAKLLSRTAATMMKLAMRHISTRENFYVAKQDQRRLISLVKNWKLLHKPNKLAYTNLMSGRDIKRKSLLFSLLPQNSTREKE